MQINTEASVEMLPNQPLNHRDRASKRGPGSASIQVRPKRSQTNNLSKASNSICCQSITPSSIEADRATTTNKARLVNSAATKSGQRQPKRTPVYAFQNLSCPSTKPSISQSRICTEFDASSSINQVTLTENSCLESQECFSYKNQLQRAQLLIGLHV